MSLNPQSSSSHTVNTTRETFDRDVFERSQQVPVIVDFWAAWCGPCRMLGPLLEKLAEQYAGRFVLVKANTEEIPDAAVAFRVQSIPAVFAVVGGNIVHSFVGLLPESQLRAWLDQVLLQQQLEQANAAEELDAVQAAQLYRSILAQAPKNAPATIGLARTLLAQEDRAGAEALLRELEDRGFLEPEAEKIKAALAIGAKQGLDVQQIRAAAEADPDDLQRQLALAEALSGAGQYQEALDICLSLVERDRAVTGESAREMMLAIFRVLPNESELTRDYRRRLSMLLY